MRKLSFLFLLLFMGCHSIQVTHDYDRKIDFSKYKTFNYYPQMNSGLSELDENRLLDAIDAHLTNKGFTLSENAELLINIKTSDYHSMQQSTVGLGLGGGGGQVGGGVSVGIPLGQDKTNRVIQIDVLDQNGLIYQAIMDSPYFDKATPDERTKHMQNIVEKAFEKFPPPQEVR